MDPLQRVRLGTTDLEVTRVSLGCAPIGGLYSNIPDEQAQQVVSTALEAGINFIDTAALYGAGTSERRVGAALRGVARDGYVLATKVGWRFEHVPGPSGFSEYWDSPGAWMVECRQRLQRRLGRAVAGEQPDPAGHRPPGRRAHP